MSDGADDEQIENWQARAELAEAALVEMRAKTNEALARAELKAEAVRAGMVDLDGLKLIDVAEVKLGPQGEIADAAGLLTRLKRAKPWLFSQAASSSVAAHAPRPEPPRLRHANELSHEEWLTARAALLKRR